jgi:protein-tyrosine phosphatase
MFNFAPASANEAFVFGAQRPGYYSSRPIPVSEVATWIDFMEKQGIKDICCLLEDQLAYYENDLLETYRHRFGRAKVCWAPIPDFTLADESALTSTILPFLSSSVRLRDRVVVHCSGGIGRTGHVLAAWLVYGRGMSNEEAISAVLASGRNPYEAEGSDRIGRLKLETLLNACRAGSILNRSITT